MGACFFKLLGASIDMMTNVVFFFVDCRCFHKDDGEYIYIYICCYCLYGNNNEFFLILFCPKWQRFLCWSLTCLFYLHLLCICFVDEKARNEEWLKVVFVFFFVNVDLQKNKQLWCGWCPLCCEWKRYGGRGNGTTNVNRCWGFGSLALAEIVY
jgi:hypothetical protein